MKSIDKFVLVLVASLALLLAGCGGGSSTTAPVDPGPTDEELAQMQTSAIMTASGEVNTALAALSGSEPTQAQIDDVNTAISGLQAALSAAVNVDDAAKAGYHAQIMTAQGAVSRAEAALMAANDAAAEAARMAMAAMTAKLWAGIGETPLASNGANTAIDPTSGVLTVQRGTETAAPLAENEDATVASLHGWVGSEHTAEVAADGTYTARLYSNVGEATEGAKFNDSANGGYSLTDGVLTSGFDSNGSRIASPMFDHSAGNKSFTLPDPNPNGETVINIRGSYHGVPGTYMCTPGGSSCTATKAAGEGYTLAGGGTWAFTPDDAEQRLTEVPDMVYAFYGWWLHEAADDTAIVSAFFGYRGAEAASGVDTLQGSATYKGGAAGKYAVSAGAHNDSGHFTADAELKANFDTDMISGTINNFMGGDDMPRDWSVALKAGPVDSTGGIATVASGTTWTMGGTDAAASGSWEGSLYNNNAASSIPSVGAGKFHSEFGNTGRMVGAFGVDLED